MERYTNKQRNIIVESHIRWKICWNNLQTWFNLWWAKSNELTRKTSSRYCSLQFDISRSSLQRITVRDLLIQPYKITIIPEIKITEHSRRRKFGSSNMKWWSRFLPCQIRQQVKFPDLGACRILNSLMKHRCSLKELQYYMAFDVMGS